MQWRCYAWSGREAPTEAERANPDASVPGIHPRDWLVKPVRYESYDNGAAAAKWFHDLMNRARIDPAEILIDVTINNILHGVDVSRWLRLPDGAWLSWAVLTVEGSPNGQASMANA
jgi:hypothetical protein